MILNLGSAIFNAETASGGGTPAWGTEMGQGDGYRFNFEDYESLITALVYNSIPNPGTRIYCPLGKGGNQASDYEFVVASKFNKIFVNGKRVNNCSFVLLVVRNWSGKIMLADEPLNIIHESLLIVKTIMTIALNLSQKH